MVADQPSFGHRWELLGRPREDVAAVIADDGCEHVEWFLVGVLGSHRPHQRDATAQNFLVIHGQEIGCRPLWATPFAPGYLPGLPTCTLLIVQTPAGPLRSAMMKV